MKAGTVDAGVLSPPFNAMATQMGYRTLAYFGDYVEQSLSGVGTSDKMIRERPDLVKRMLTATIKSLRFIQQRPAESTQFIAKEWSVDSAAANELYKSMLPAFSKDGGMDEKGIRDALQARDRAHGAQGRDAAQSRAGFKIAAGSAEGT